jgi:hypothetical protein
MIVNQHDLHVPCCCNGLSVGWHVVCEVAQRPTPELLHVRHHCMGQARCSLLLKCRFQGRRGFFASRSTLFGVLVMLPPPTTCRQRTARGASDDAQLSRYCGMYNTGTLPTYNILSKIINIIQCTIKYCAMRSRATSNDAQLSGKSLEQGDCGGGNGKHLLRCAVRCQQQLHVVDLHPEVPACFRTTFYNFMPLIISCVVGRLHFLYVSLHFLDVPLLFTGPRCFDHGAQSHQYQGDRFGHLFHLCASS